MRRTHDGVEYNEDGLEGETECPYDRRLEEDWTICEVLKIIDSGGRAIRTLFVAW